MKYAPHTDYMNQRTNVDALNEIRFHFQSRVIRVQTVKGYLNLRLEFICAYSSNANISVLLPSSPDWFKADPGNTLRGMPVVEVDAT